MASNALFKRDVKAREMGVRLFFGSILVGASGAVTSHTCFGFTPTDAGTGKFLLTFACKYPKLLGVMPMIVGSAGDLGRFVISNDSLASAGTVEITHIGATGAADVADGATLKLMIAVKNTTVK